jgi:hypothetical protein
MQRIAGMIQLMTDGTVQDAKGSFTYNLGAPKREIVAGADRVHGYKEMPQAGFIEGVITDRGTLDVKALVKGANQTITLTVGNGKTIMLSGGVYTGDGNITTEEGEIAVRWDGEAEEV